MMVSLPVIQSNIRLSIAETTMDSNISFINTILAGMGGGLGATLAQFGWSRIKQKQTAKICDEIDLQDGIKTGKERYFSKRNSVINYRSKLHPFRVTLNMDSFIFQRGIICGMVSVSV